jgi:hypothetical protein
MSIAISGVATVGAALAAPTFEAQPKAVEVQQKAAAAAPAGAGEDAVKISAAAREVPQPMCVQVRALHNQGKSIPQIATKLSISPNSVQSYLGTPAAKPKK